MPKQNQTQNSETSSQLPWTKHIQTKKQTNPSPRLLQNSIQVPVATLKYVRRSLKNKILGN